MKPAGGGVWALVPLKSPAAAKSRLSGVLTPAQRRALHFALAGRVLDSLARSRGIDHVAVVTASDEVARYACRRGARVIRQQGEPGTAAAFRAGIDALRACRPRSLLMIAGDLPLVSPAAIERLLGAAQQTGVVIVPDRREVGTNALLCCPPTAIEPCFGADSFARHLQAARERGVSARVHRCAALSLDLDEAEDLDHLGLQAGRMLTLGFDSEAVVTL